VARYQGEASSTRSQASSNKRRRSTRPP